MAQRNLIVTGSTSGIGFGNGEALASQRCDVLINGFGVREEIRDIQNELEDRIGIKTHYSDADMYKPDEIGSMVQVCERMLKSVDIQVNNASLQHTAIVEDCPTERRDLILAINLSSNSHAIRASLQLMKSNVSGCIVKIASAHGLVGSKEKSANVAARHCVVGLTKVVTLENPSTSVTCSTECRGRVLKPFVQNKSKTWRAGTLHRSMTRVCVHNTKSVQEIEGTVERLATGLGRKVPAIVNCYSFKVDEAVIDEYSAMVVRIEKRFYSDVSRYTTSAFLCAKRGEKLASRGVQPHLYEAISQGPEAR